MTPGFSIVLVSNEPGAVRAEVEMAPGGGWFEGHFPGEPTLPAIGHLDLVAQVQHAAGGSGLLAGIDRLRLTRPVRPGDRLELVLDWTGEAGAEAGASRFTLRRIGGDEVSGGTVRWVPNRDGGDGG